MKSVPLQVIKNLVNLPIDALRRRYQRCARKFEGKSWYQASQLPKVSAGRMVVHILQHEYDCIELLALHEELFDEKL